MSKTTTKRLRIFAGPNGSGKSTLAEILKHHKNKNIKLGIFVNADEIEKKLINTQTLLLSDYNLTATTKEIQTFIISEGVSPIKLNDKHIFKKFSIVKNKLFFSGKYNSYIAADIASFIRVNLLTTGKNFSIETVFSHESKLQFMKYAKSLGYRVYFYFIATDDPEINVNRVDIRVAKDGHAVDKKKIIDRYYRALELLYDAIKNSDRTFLFDNSGKYYSLIAEINNGKKVELNVDNTNVPNWFIKYVYEKTK